MATKVKITGIEGVELSVRKTFKAVAKNKQMLKQIGEVSIERMKGEARRTSPLQGDKKGSFPSNYPKKSTQRTREYLAKYNATHKTYSKARGNLTITGQLIDALKFKVKDGVVNFFISGRRKKYKTKSGRAIKGQETDNAKVYEKLLEMNRKFRIIGVDEKLQKRITNIVKRTLRRAISIRNKLNK